MNGAHSFTEGSDCHLDDVAQPLTHPNAARPHLVSPLKTAARALIELRLDEPCLLTDAVPTGPFAFIVGL